MRVRRVITTPATPPNVRPKETFSLENGQLVIRKTEPYTGGATISVGGIVPGAYIQSRPFSKSVPFVVIGPEHPAWAAGTVPAEASGAIVWVQPPPGAPETLIEAFRASLGQVAKAVRYVPGQRGALLSEKRKSISVSGQRSIREVVTTMIEEAHSVDKEALQTLCESILSEAGL